MEDILGPFAFALLILGQFTAVIAVRGLQQNPDSHENHSNRTADTFGHAAEGLRAN
jgi:hypothetical protein